MSDPAPVAYETRLREDSDLMLREVGKFAEGDSMVQRTLKELASRLDDLGIPYAVLGGLALGAHGFVRATVEIDGIRFVTIDKLIELKLASGMTASDRLKDLADVQELVKATGLPLELSTRLDPSVRATYEDLWHKARPTGEEG